MTPARYQQIGEIYLAALELEPARRNAFLDEACAGDDALRKEVESLASNQEAGTFISESALELIAGELAEEQQVPLAGKSIGHYFVHYLLGTGGMSEMYLAEDIRLHRKVALKLLPVVFAQYVDRLGRFEQEARTVSALNHPNRVTIYDIGCFDDRQHIATELIEGSTFRDRIATGWTLQELLHVVIQITSALNAAHHDEGPFGDHLRRMWLSLSQDEDLCDSVRSLLQGDGCPQPEHFYRLRSAGLALGDSARDPRLRCQLYNTYLERRLP